MEISKCLIEISIQKHLKASNINENLQMFNGNLHQKASNLHQKAFEWFFVFFNTFK